MFRELKLLLEKAEIILFIKVVSGISINQINSLSRFKLSIAVLANVREKIMNICNFKQSLLFFVLLFTGFSLKTQCQATAVFTSYTGGFTINLPESKNGISGNGTAGGIAFSWRQPEATYEIGFYELQGLPLAKVDGEFSFEEAVKQYFNKFSTNGERVYEKDISLQENEGHEYKYITRSSIFLLRLFSVDDRIYKLVAEIPLKGQNQEERVLEIFNSFRFLDRQTVNTVMAKKLAEATPESLPQSPIVLKLKSDAQDENLKGKVKSVLLKIALFSLKNSLRKPGIKSVEDFDKSGNLIKQIEYDGFGNPSIVDVYGYVSGKRVSRSGSISHEYDIGGILIGSSTSVKFDDRFDKSYIYKYTGNHIAEERTYRSNGDLLNLIIHRYLEDGKESVFYDGGKNPYQKIVSKLDAKGNETELTIYTFEKNKFVEVDKFREEYEAYDEKGNWTKKTSYKSYGWKGSENFQPEYVEYRTMTYYE